MEGYRKLPWPHLLSGKTEGKKDKKDKKESEKHKDEGSGAGMCVDINGSFSDFKIFFMILIYIF